MSEKTFAGFDRQTGLFGFCIKSLKIDYEEEDRKVRVIAGLMNHWHIDVIATAACPLL